MKIQLAEFKNDVWVPGVKNMKRTSRLDANSYPGVEMHIGPQGNDGVPPAWLAIRVDGVLVTLVPPGNLDEAHPAADVDGLRVKQGAKSEVVAPSEHRKRS